MNYRPLNMFVKQTDELKELIKKYPDYPIVVLVGSEVVADDDCAYWYAPELRYKITEILDCEQEVDDLRIYSDRDFFKEDVENMLAADVDENISDEEFEKLVESELQKYEQYWKPVIAICADV